MWMPFHLVMPHVVNVPHWQVSTSICAPKLNSDMTPSLFRK